MSCSETSDSRARGAAAASSSSVSSRPYRDVVITSSMAARSESRSSLEQLHEVRARLPLCGLEVLELAAQPLEQHVEVANGPERVREPGELGAERLRPVRVEQGLRGAEDGAQAPRGDAGLVQLLRIAPEPGAGVMGEQLGDLARQHGAHVLERRRPLGRRRRLDGEVAQCPKGLRPSVARLGAGRCQHPPEAGQCVGATLERLHLELDEALPDTAALEDRHPVEGDVRDGAAVS